MAVTIDSIAPGRFGVNIVSGWQAAEYTQMGLWPGDEYFGYRYDYSSEYVAIMRELWATGSCTLAGEHFTMDDCRLGPLPEAGIPIVSAGQSDRGMDFCADHADFNFIMGTGTNTPVAHANANARLAAACERTGRDVGVYVLMQVIAAETDEEAFAKWDHYRAGADVEALGWIADQASRDVHADPSSTGATIKLPERAVNFNQGTLVGSYASIARMLDETAAVPGTKGIMLTFDDFIEGLDAFGNEIQPRMATRADRLGVAA
jgi:pyrimidine oxygenase